jgi:hypothetical protein
LGEYLTLRGGAGSHVTDESPCSGQITAKGKLADVYLAKFSALTGEVAWIKRFGQLDTFESAVSILTDDYNHEVMMIGDYFNAFSFERYRDIFDLVAAGRPSAVGCQVDRIDTQIKERTGKLLTDDAVGQPNCSMIGNSQSGSQISAFILSVDVRNRAHAHSPRPSRPASQCNATEEVGCNADGLLWARAFSSGIREASTRTSTRAGGIS